MWAGWRQRAVRGRSGVCCEKNEEKNADEEEKSELESHDEAAGDKRGAAVAPFFAASRRCTMFGPCHDYHREKRAADEAGPERVFGREAERKHRRVNLWPENSGDLRDFIPAAGMR